jgi:AcrR family transcriptional regulator
MSGRTSKQRVNTPRHTRRKRTQRERLLAGMATVANRDGYARANVSAVIAQAGVSRPTFYEYFTDKDDCFITALAEAHERLLAGVRQKIEGRAPEHATDAAIEALVEFAATQPSGARLVMSESMAAGPRSLDERDRGIFAIEQMIEAARDELDAATALADVSPRMAIGGVYRVLASRLRRGEPLLGALTGDLLHWIGDYARPVAEHRWRLLAATSAPAPSPFVPETPMQAPMALGPGRPRMSQEQVAANHRQRILYAAAQLAEKRGYTATTISEITKLARVDGRAFYSLFSDKQDAFMTVHELGFQEIMAVTAGAFFSAATWPERSWEAARAFTQFLQRNPTVAHVGFVEAFAVGEGAIQRVEDSHVAFTMFLQEGYQLHPRNPPSRLALEAIIKTIFEIVYHHARANPRPQLATLAPHLTFLWIAPFTGAAEASEFIEEQLTVAQAG